MLGAGGRLSSTSVPAAIPLSRYRSADSSDIRRDVSSSVRCDRSPSPDQNRWSGRQPVTSDLAGHGSPCELASRLNPPSGSYSLRCTSPSLLIICPPCSVVSSRVVDLTGAATAPEGQRAWRPLASTFLVRDISFHFETHLQASEVQR